LDWATESESESANKHAATLALRPEIPEIPTINPKPNAAVNNRQATTCFHPRKNFATCAAGKRTFILQNEAMKPSGRCVRLRQDNQPFWQLAKVQFSSDEVNSY